MRDEDAAIAVRELTRSFDRPDHSVRAWRRFLPGRGPRESTVALHPITFDVARGERVALIGPNGAGKSTTIKMLTGILHPSGGSARVLGRVPWHDRTELAFEIATVFGQKSQLWYHLPPRSTFELLRHVYDLEDSVVRGRVADLTERLSLGSILDRPVRTLSLGERMRCELAAALLHAPRLAFLDEPTIGLDVVARQAVRAYIREMNARDGTTIFLTSHDAADIEQVCDRAIVLQAGRVAFDGPVSTLRDRFVRVRSINVRFLNPVTRPETLPPGTVLAEVEAQRWRLEVEGVSTAVGPVVAWALAHGPVADVDVADPPMEEVIASIYRDVLMHGSSSDPEIQP
jgi:ABC-2 type transport system ATP-binding protein